MSDVIKNMIAKNKRAIFDVEAIVQFNVGQIQVARSTIEETLPTPSRAIWSTPAVTVS